MKSERYLQPGKCGCLLSRSSLPVCDHSGWGLRLSIFPSAPCGVGTHPWMAQIIQDSLVELFCSFWRGPVEKISLIPVAHVKILKPNADLKRSMRKSEWVRGRAWAQCTASIVVPVYCGPFLGEQIRRGTVLRAQRRMLPVSLWPHQSMRTSQQLRKESMETTGGSPSIWEESTCIT